MPPLAARRACVLVALMLAAFACGESADGSGPSGGSGGTAMSGSGGGGGSGGQGVAGSGGSATGSGGEPAADAASDGPAQEDVVEPAEAAPADGSSDAGTPNGPAKIVLVAGGGNGGDGTPALMAKLSEPFGTSVDPMTGDIYIAEYQGGHVRRIDASGKISTVVGAGAAGPGGGVTLKNPHDLLFQPGTRILFIADTFNNRVFRMDASTGEIAAFAGAGTQVASGIVQAYCLAFDPEVQHLYVTDTSGGKIASIDLTTKAVTTITTPKPRAIAMDSKKNLYVVAVGSNVLKKIDSGGMTSNVVDMLNAPKHLTIDADNNVVIADTESHSIFTYFVATSKLVRIVGNGTAGTGMLGGAPELAQTARPHGVVFDGQGRLYISDSENNRVLRIEH